MPKFKKDAIKIMAQDLAKVNDAKKKDREKEEQLSDDFLDANELNNMLREGFGLSIIGERKPKKEDILPSSKPLNKLELRNAKIEIKAGPKKEEITANDEEKQKKTEKDSAKPLPAKDVPMPAQKMPKPEPKSELTIRAEIKKPQSETASDMMIGEVLKQIEKPGAVIESKEQLKEAIGLNKEAEKAAKIQKKEEITNQGEAETEEEIKKHQAEKEELENLIKETKENESRIEELKKKQQLMEEKKRALEEKRQMAEAENKKHEEALQAQMNKNKELEEKRKQLAMLEAEREKKLHEKQVKEVEEERRIQEQTEEETKKYQAEKEALEQLRKETEENKLEIEALRKRQGMEAEERRILERKRQIAEEENKKHQEALRIQIEKNKQLEEKRQQLIQIEADRERRLKEKMEERQKQIQEIAQTEDEKAKKKLIMQESNRLDKAREAALLVVLKELIARLKSKKAQLDKKFGDFSDFNVPLEQKRRGFEAEISRINDTELVAIREKEEEIEKQEEEIENSKKKQNLDAQQAKAIEQKLWMIEDQRKSIEKQRWETEDKINKLEIEIKKIDLEINKKKNEGENLLQMIKEISDQQRLIDFALEKRRLEMEVLKIIKERENLEPALNVAVKKREEIEARLKDLTSKQKADDEKLATIKKQEKQTADAAQKRIIEQEKWKTEELLRKLTQSKWDAEEILKKAADEERQLMTKMEIIKSNIEKIEDDISNKEIILESTGLKIFNLRDVIANLIKENGLEVNPDYLKDIIQAQDVQGPLPEKATLSAQNANVDLKKEANLPQQPQENAAMNAKPKPGTEINGTVNMGNKEADKSSNQAIDTAAPKPLQGINGAEKSTNTNPASINTNNGNIKVLDKIEVTSNGKEPEATKIDMDKIKEILTKKAAAPTAKEADGAKPTAAPEIAAANQKQIPAADQEIKEPAAVKPANIPTMPKLESSEGAKKLSESANSGAYNGLAKQVTPAKNIPAFPETKPSVKPNTAPKAIEPLRDEKTTEAKTATTKMPTIGNVKPGAGLRREPINNTIEDEPAASGAWGDRWGQIKKSAGAPAQNAVPTATATAATAPTSSEATQKPASLSVARTEDLAAGNSKSDNGKKSLVRILIVLVCVGILGVAAVLILSKKSTPAPATPPVAGGNTTNGNNQTKGEDTGTGTVPEATNTKKDILATISNVPIYTKDTSTVPNLLFPYLKNGFESDGYYRVTIQDNKTNTTVGLRQFFDIFKINAPAEFYNFTSNDFILFIYSNKGKNRLGFVTEITDKTGTLAATMNNWEKNLEQDTGNFYKFLGKKTQSTKDALKFISKNVPSSDIQYRSLAFVPATDNLTISYALYNGKYFIFTTSDDSLVNIFKQLPK